MPWNTEKSKATQFTTDKSEPCTAQISLRVPPSMKQKLKHEKGWQDKVRKFLEKEINAQSA